MKELDEWGSFNFIHSFDKYDRHEPRIETQKEEGPPTIDFTFDFRISYFESHLHIQFRIHFHSNLLAANYTAHAYLYFRFCSTFLYNTLHLPHARKKYPTIHTYLLRLLSS